MISTADAERRPIPLVAIGLAAALTYAVLIGGTAIGETSVILRSAGALIGSAFIAGYIMTASREADGIDRGVLVALLPFALAGVLSLFPRQSLDAVVTALAYVCALFAARGVLADEPARRLFVATLVGLSAVMTLITTRIWLVPIAEWWGAVGLSTTPPLGMELSAFPWGHRHDLALLVAMLYPAWWLGRPSPLRRMAAVVFGVLGILIVLVDGSRALWGAIGLATAVVILPRFTAWVRRRDATRPVLVGAGVLLLLVVVTGIGGALVQRASNLATVEWRAALWSGLVESWLQHPVSGSGPGSFVWILQPTGYFDTNSWAPRHPDNAVVHMVAEGGLLGIATLAILAIVLIPRILNSSSAAGRWVLITFGIALLGANPSDFSFMVAVAIAWTAYSLPRQPAESPTPFRLRPATIVTTLLLGALAVAQVAGTVAAVGYERAREAVAEGDLTAGRGALGVAIALDPGMAIYARERGTLYLLEGNFSGAVADLRLARVLNPADDIAARVEALAFDALGDTFGRDRSLADALRAQRSDPTNLLMAADFASEADAAAILAEVVHAWPTTVFSPGWAAGLPAGTRTVEIVGAALDRWLADEPIPELEAEQGVWLATMAGRQELIGEAVARSPWTEELSRALSAAIACETTRHDLDAMTPAARRNVWYWLIRYRASALAGDPDENAARMAEIMGLRMPREVTSMAEMSPLNENDRLSADRWGYRRTPIMWPRSVMTLPNPRAGTIFWVADPGAAADMSGLEAQPVGCH